MSWSKSTVLALLGLVLAAPAWATDWRQFRGNEATSSARDERLPAALADAAALRWKAAMPGRTVSSPIIVDGRVISTCSSGRGQSRLHVFCFDAATGAARWERQFWATGRTLCHETSAVAAPSPASDGQRVFAFFSSNDLVCLDLDGNLQWMRGLTREAPTAANDVGMSASPVVSGDTVVVQLESQGESFALGIGAAGGETRWRVDRKPQANWCSPTLLKLPVGDPKSPSDSQELVLLQSGDKATAHDPRTGEQRWAFEEPCSTIASAGGWRDLVFMPSAGIAAVRPQPGSANVDIAWREPKLSASTASPVVHRDRLYVINRAGVLVCANPEDGQPVWNLRLKGTFWATPVAAGERLYAVNQEGTVQTVQLTGEKGELVEEHALGEEVLSTPAVADGALYIRGIKHLWKFGGESR